MTKWPLGKKAVFDMEKLYCRLLVLSGKIGITLVNVFAHELCPVPSSLFDFYGHMRNPGTKSLLVKKKKKLAEYTLTWEIDAEVIDGPMMFYHVTWPKKATVTTLCDNYQEVIRRQQGVYVAFDSYNPDSVKAHERNKRKGETVYPDYKLE